MPLKNVLDVMNDDMTIALTRTQMNDCFGGPCPCGQPHPQISQITSSCHYGAPVIAGYQEETGMVKLVCAICLSPVVAVVVSDKTIIKES